MPWSVELLVPFEDRARLEVLAPLGESLGDPPDCELRLEVLVPVCREGVPGAVEPTVGRKGSATSSRAAESPGTVSESLAAMTERILYWSVSWER